MIQTISSGLLVLDFPGINDKGLQKMNRIHTDSLVMYSGLDMNSDIMIYCILGYYHYIFNFTTNTRWF